MATLHGWRRLLADSVPDAPSFYLVFAWVSDWEAGGIDTPMPASSVFTDAAEARSSFRQRVDAIRSWVTQESDKVENGVAEGHLVPTGGLNVVLRLYRVPRSRLQHTDAVSTAWELQGETDDYLVEDESYAVEYGDGESFSGGETHVDPDCIEIDLTDYLPPPDRNR
jgi:hypothetical protein